MGSRIEAPGQCRRRRPLGWIRVEPRHALQIIPLAVVQVVIFNFRADRVLELTKAFEEENFEPFDRKRVPKVRRASCSLLYNSSDCRPAVQSASLCAVESQPTCCTNLSAV